MAAKATKKTEEVKFTKYEKARILGSRALQVSMGAPYLIKISKKKLEELKYNPLEIARLEFDAGVIPITVVRPLPKVDLGEE
jgi:DNA-directed RNA polymerase subunit K/omega